MERILQTRGVYTMNLVALGTLEGRLHILHGVQPTCALNAAARCEIHGAL
jgi:hypothetical protein